jgi:hypothetical protein
MVCKSHHAAIEQSLRENGLWHLVPTDGCKASQVQIKNLRGIEDKETYDPLLVLMMACSQRAVAAAGIKQGVIYLHSPEFYCPFCEAEKHTGDMDRGQNWIDSCVQEIVQYCLSKHYIGPDYMKVNPN